MTEEERLRIYRSRPPCRHGDGLGAIARLTMTEGCSCFPDDREQDLCGQHIMRDGMLGEVHVVEIYDEEAAKFYGIWLDK